MPHERLKPTFTFDEERLKQLQQIAPEAFADGQINWDTLKEALGEYLEDDGPDAEHFGLFWPGKKQARKMAATPSKGTLVPVYGEGLKADGTPDTDGNNDSRNIFIEGENLEVLKILQKSYAGRIKMIYIDPPYNTGNDFVYEDDFKEPLQEYLRRTGQVDEEGKPLTTNTRADGRFHSKWLSMMYPRLRLARNLLRDDGVIFVSIDDNEVHNLRAIMNEIFGEECFIEQISWKNKYGAGAQTKGFISVHEYILCYSKTTIENIDSPLTEEAKKAYNKTDNKYNERGRYFTQPLMTNSLGDRGNLQYSIFYNGEEIIPNKQWVWSKERLLKAIENDEVVFNKMKDGTYSVRSKQYLIDENGMERKGKPLSLMNGPFTQEGTADIVELFGYNPFGFVKPVELIKYLFTFTINNIESDEDIFMDFFAGSGTSAQSVLKLNSEDNKRRKFICVQIPETINENDSNGKKAIKELNNENKPNSISELTKERIRKSFKKYNINNGFHILKLGKSNYKSWQNYEGTDLKQLEMQFGEFTSPLVDNWKEENLLTEIILMEGFPLDSSIEGVKNIKTNTIKQVTSGFHEHKLLVCLDKKITYATIQSLKLTGDDVFICLDSAITDQDKLQLADKGMIKTI